jgi:hypothetical protein
MDSTRKELSPYSEQRVVLLSPEDSTPNWRRVEMSADAPNLRDYWQVVRNRRRDNIIAIRGRHQCQRND